MPASRPPAPGRAIRRWLFLIHRWLGIGGCLLFAMWFVSGLVMVYVPYPALTPAERLAGLEPIRWAAVTVPPPLDAGRLPAALRLEMRDGVPVWRETGRDGRERTIPATRDAAMRDVDAAYAARVAGRFGGAPALRVTRVARDQWTVAGGFDAHRPLWKVALDDGAGSEAYVSSASGGVVQATTRRDRFWNWIGAVPHWLYLTIVRQDQPRWRQLVLWVSGPCIAVAVTGLWIGLLRVRPGRRRFAGGRVTPYRGWMLWHHVAGLGGGAALLAWIFSGWLSVDPGRVFRGSEPPAAALRAYDAGDAMPALPLSKVRALPPGATLAELTDHAGTPRLILSAPDRPRLILDPATLAPAPLPPGTIIAAARRLMAPARLIAAERLAAPDAYWYGPDAGPVLRLRFADPARTWLYIDPASGEILAHPDRRRRVYRWAFDLLHKWDLNILTRHRPARDVLLWLLSAAGLVTSVSGVWLGWRRLARDRRRRAA